MVRFKIIQIDPKEWAARFASSAHVAVFGEHRPGYSNRIDYALLVIDVERDVPVAYLTARELDHESIYWQYGGSFKPHFRPHTALTIYNQLIAWHGERYKRVSTFTKNDNLEYLRIALKCGFLVIGTRTFNGDILLDLLNSFDEEVRDGLVDTTCDDGGGRGEK